MSNKVKLPDGSLKQAKKSYKEICVSAPKAKPDIDGELVAVTALPPWAWAHEVFNVPKLNRVQSKVFPVTSGTNSTLCSYWI